jgi:ammonia channel protein AmtB
VLSIVTLDKLRLDDPVGAISVHGTVGIWGLLAVPIYNGPAKLWVQIAAVDFPVGIPDEFAGVVPDPLIRRYPGRRAARI